MAILTGNGLTVTIGGSSGSDVPHVISLNVPETRTMIDVTAAGDDTTVSVPGLKPGTFTFEAWLDLSNSSLESAITNASTTSVSAELDGTEIISYSSAYITRSIQSGGPNGAARATYTVHAAA